MSAPHQVDVTTAGSHRLDETACADRFVRDVTITAASQLAPRSQVAVTTFEQGSLTDRSSSDRRCADCESVGHSSGQGPGVNALARDRIVLVRDLEGDQRWPVWADRARSHGFRSAAAVPARVVEGSALLLVGYSETGDAWDSSSLAAMARCAQELAHLLALSRRCAEQQQANMHLKSALASRGTIGQAMGIIMAQNRCSADTAFSILRSASQHRNLKLREVAASLTEAVCEEPEDSSVFREG